jgi:hypothetical protein
MTLTARTSFLGVIAAILLSLATPTLAQEIPALTATSDPKFASRRAALMQERTTLHAKVDNLNAQCAAVVKGSTAEASCRRDRAQLMSVLDSHIQRSNDFNALALAASVAPIGTAHQSVTDQNPIVPNLANDPNAARLSAAQLRLVDGRIANLQRAIALLSDSNPEWARERERLLEAQHEDRVDFSWECVNLVSLGLARLVGQTTESRMEGAKIDALLKAFKEPLAGLPAEEARVSRIMAASQDPKLTGAIQEYLNALHRYREAQDTHDVAVMFTRVRDSVEALVAEFELMKSKPPRSDDIDGLYVSSAMVGRIAMIFAEGSTATVATYGSAGASILVGGREAINLWQEYGQLAALDQNASDRNRMKVELNARLNSLHQEHDRLDWAAQRAKTAASPR